MFVKALLVGACAALAAAQSSVLSFTRVPNPMTDGQPQAILFATNDTQTPATITLRKGPSGNLKTVATLTTSALNGQFIWSPPLSLPNGVNYALEIKQGTQINYFGPFQIQGANPQAVSSASAAASSSGSASASGSSSSKNSTSTSSKSTSTGNSTTKTTSTVTTHRTSVVSTTSVVSSTPATQTSSVPTPNDNGAATYYGSFLLGGGAVAGAFAFLL